MTYPHDPGYKADGTSMDAAQSVAQCASDGRLICLRALVVHGPMTADEVAERTGLDRLYVRPRMSELTKLGSIRANGQRRRNQSGRWAAVMEVIFRTPGVPQ